MVERSAVNRMVVSSTLTLSANLGVIMLLGLVIVGIFSLEFLFWFDTYCELKDLRRDVRKAIVDIERIMPKATHPIKTEVLSVLRRLKC